MVRYYLTGGLIFLLVVGGAVGLYFFYFRALLAEYDRQEEYLDALVKRYEDVSRTFSGTQANVIVEEYQKNIEPWEMAVKDRLDLFEATDEVEPEELPGEGEELLKFFYGDRYNEIINELTTDLATRGVMMYADRTFGVPTPDTIVATTPDQVKLRLNTLKTGVMMTRRLMDAGARRIDQVVLWPTKSEDLAFTVDTYGLAFAMTLDDLVTFMESLNNGENFYRIDGFKITNENLMAGSNALLDVSLLLSHVSNVKLPEPGAAPAPGAPPAFGGAPAQGAQANQLELLQALRQRQAAGGGAAVTQPKEKSWWQKLWPFGGDDKPATAPRGPARRPDVEDE